MTARQPTRLAIDHDDCHASTWARTDRDARAAYAARLTELGDPLDSGEYET